MKNLKTFEQFSVNEENSKEAWEEHEEKAKAAMKKSAQDEEKLKKKKEQEKEKCAPCNEDFDKEEYEEGMKKAQSTMKKNAQQEKNMKKKDVEAKESRVLSFSEFSEEQLNEGIFGKSKKKKYEELKAKTDATPQEVYKVFIDIFEDTTDNLDNKVKIWTKNKHISQPTVSVLMKCMEDGYKENYASIIGIKDGVLSYIPVEEAKRLTKVDQGSIAGY